MLMLVGQELPPESRDSLLGDNVFYRPDLPTRDSRSLTRALVDLEPDVLIVERRPDAACVQAWRQQRPCAYLFIVQTGAEGDVDALDFDEFDVPVHLLSSDPSASIADGFVLAERIYNAEVTCREIRLQTSRWCASSADVLLVGAGIVNLMTAHHLMRSGYTISIVDGCPDPRSSGPWTGFGCTRGGGGARMLTLTEADDYHDQDDVVTAHLNSQFTRSIADGGWLVREEKSLSVSEQRWTNDHHAVPSWLARAYNADTFSFNRQSRDLWEELIRDEPELFEGCGLARGILRLYTDREQLDWSAVRHQRIGALQKILTPGEVGDRHPALADVCDAHGVAGGLEVEGFTLNVHSLMAHLVDALEAGGVDCVWEQRVEEIERDDSGAVAGLKTREKSWRASNYVISPGVYGGDLLHGTASEDKLQGVLGVWITIPNLSPQMTHSIKSARKGHPAEDANITVTTDERERSVLVIGSGYGYTGLDPSSIDAEQLDLLYEATEDTARFLFPKGYEAAVEDGSLLASRRLCIRPWTASGLGLFEVQETDDGGRCIVTGGHNTGGFTQSLSVAQAVRATLLHRPHPMQELYHPNRLQGFLRATRL